LEYIKLINIKSEIYINELNNLITINNDPEIDFWLRDQITILTIELQLFPINKRNPVFFSPETG